MKVVLFFSYEISLRDWARSGLLQREIRLYTELIRLQDIQVVFLTYGDESDREWSQALGNIELLPVYENIKRPNGWLLRLIHSCSIPWRYRQELQQCDVFKTNQMMGAWVAVIAKWLCRKPLLLRSGYDLSTHLEAERASVINRYLARILSQVCYRVADQINVSTANQAVQIKSRCPKSKNGIHIRPNWVDTTLFRPQLIQRKSTGKVLVVGRLSYQKNIALLAEALRGTNIQVDIVGSGNEKSSLIKKFELCGVRANFLGHIDNHLLPNIYNRCDIYVLCSRYEGNPKTLLEAMACECFVIGTDVVGIREIISTDITGILVEENSQSLRESILKFINNANLRSTFGKAARQQVVRGNSLDEAVRKEWRTYLRLKGM